MEEQQYLDLVRDILAHGVERPDRTSTGTLSVFGRQMRWNLESHFPLLTTKRVFWKGVVEELLWFINGQTDAKILSKKGITIWNDNTSREFLDARGLAYEDGDAGPIYGFQWRHFGAVYIDSKTDYTNQGVDQLTQLIHAIKTNPTSRRLIISAWNPTQLDQVALPPCHAFMQFYVSNGKLSCQLYQRSADMGLGVPFNIASYALLTCMIAHVCNLKRGEFIHTFGDAHVYLNHVDQLKIQIERTPRAFPRLVINPDKKDIDTFQLNDFEILGYTPYGALPMKMAV